MATRAQAWGGHIDDPERKVGADIIIDAFNVSMVAGADVLPGLGKLMPRDVEANLVTPLSDQTEVYHTAPVPAHVVSEALGPRERDDALSVNRRWLGVDPGQKLPVSSVIGLAAHQLGK